jgi:TonB family protein
MSAAILISLLRANLAGSAAVLLILLLRRPVRRLFGPLPGYLLWLAAPLCVLASLIPAPAHGPVLAPAVTLVAEAGRQIEPLVRSADGLADVAILVWALGAAGMAILFARRQARFVRSLGRLEPLEGWPGVLVGEHSGAGPFLLGSVRPKVVAPADFEARFEGEARALVLAHEHVHLKRGDAAVNGLAALVQCIAWFNPLAHLAARWLRMDQEIACDAVVAARHPASRRLYAETLLGAALQPRSAPFGCPWPAAGARSLKERLTMLNVAPVSPLRRTLGLGLASAIALAGAGAVWAAAPAKPHLIEQPDWLRKPNGDDVAKFYPEAAMDAGKEGMAVIDCRVRTDGTLRACRVKKQSPAKYGFGAAALKMSAEFRMKPQSRDGHPTSGGKVSIPIKFMLAG